MEARAAAIADGTADELVWLLEHPPIYTAGTSAKDADLLDARFPVYRTGPRRAIHLSRAGPARGLCDARSEAPQARCARLCPRSGAMADRDAGAVRRKGERREGRVGIWVARGAREDKIAAIGVRIRRWVTFHGVALNVDPDLDAFLRHRALRRARAWRHQPGRSGHPGDHGRCGRGAEAELRENLRLIQHSHVVRGQRRATRHGSGFAADPGWWRWRWAQPRWAGRAARRSLLPPCWHCGPRATFSSRSRSARFSVIEITSRPCCRGPGLRCRLCCGICR